MERVWVVTGTTGQYSDRHWWVEAVYATEHAANGFVKAYEAGRQAILEEIGELYDFQERHDQPWSYVAEEEWKTRSREIMDRHAPDARIGEHYADWPDYDVNSEDVK